MGRARKLLNEHVCDMAPKEKKPKEPNRRRQDHTIYGPIDNNERAKVTMGNDPSSFTTMAAQVLRG